MTMNPFEPAAPWTTAKGTGEGPGQLPREGGTGCRPLGQPLQHAKTPSCPPTLLLGQISLPSSWAKAGMTQGCLDSHSSAQEQLKSASSMGKACAQVSATPLLIYKLFCILDSRIFQNVLVFCSPAQMSEQVCLGLEIKHLL